VASPLFRSAKYFPRAARNNENTRKLDCKARRRRIQTIYVQNWLQG